MLKIQNLPYPEIGFNNAKIIKLNEDLLLEHSDLINGNVIVPKGNEIKIFQSKNFGIVCILENTKDYEGNLIPRKVYKY